MKREIEKGVWLTQVCWQQVNYNNYKIEIYHSRGNW